MAAAMATTEVPPRSANGFAAQTHCVNGHPYDDVNTYRPPGDPNRRMCRTCRADRKAA